MRGFFIFAFWITAANATLVAQIPPINWADNFSKVMTVLTPLIIAIIGYFQIRASRRADAAATLAAAKAEEVKDAAKLAVEAAEEVRLTLKETTNETNGKLDVIHALNNSALTSSMKSDETSQTLNVVMMEEMLEISGRSPSAKALETLTKAKGRLEELRKAIIDREQQQAIINSKIAEGVKKSEKPMEVLVANKEPLKVIDVEKK